MPNFLIDYVVPIMTGVIFLGFLFWVGYFLNKALWMIGFWKKIAYRRLKRKFAKKNFEPTEKIVEWVERALDKNWSFQDMKRFAKYEKKNKDEYLWAYFLMEEMKKDGERNNVQN